MATKIKKVILTLLVISLFLKIDCFATSYYIRTSPDGSIIDNSYDLKDFLCKDKNGNIFLEPFGDLNLVYLKGNLYPVMFTSYKIHGFYYLVLGNFIAKSSKASFIQKQSNNNFYCNKELYDFIKSLSQCPYSVSSVNGADNMSPNSSIVNYAKLAFPSATGSNINYGNLPGWMQKNSRVDYVLMYDRVGRGFCALGYDLGTGNTSITLSQLIVQDPNKKPIIDLDNMIPKTYGLRAYENIPDIQKSSLIGRSATLLSNNVIDINTVAVCNLSNIIINYDKRYTEIPPDGSKLFINGLEPRITHNGNCFIPVNGNTIATLSYISVRNDSNNEDYVSGTIYGYELRTDASRSVIQDKGTTIYTLFPHNTNINIARSITDLLQKAEAIVSQTRSIIDMAIDNIKKYGGTAEFRGVITSKVGIVIFMIIPILLLFGRSTILFIFSFWENNRLVKTLTSDVVPIIQVLSFGFHDYESLTSKSYLPEYVLNLTAAFLLFNGNILYIIKFISDMVRMLMNRF